MSYKYKASVCAIIKNEIDLEEWASYYLLIGFDHLYIYDDHSAISVAKRLEGIKNSVTVVNYKYESKNLRGKQVSAYSDCLRKFGKETEYLAFFDGDEYLVLKKHKNIKEFLNAHRDQDGFGINWLMFNSNGHVSRPDGLVIESYTRCDGGNNHIKTLIRTKSISRCGIHNVIAKPNAKYLGMDGEPVVNYVHEANRETIQLNHYHQKSLEDWGYRMIRKQCKGNSKSVQEFYVNYADTDTTIVDQGWPEKVKAFMKAHKLSNDCIAKTRIKLPSDFKWYNYLYLNPELAAVDCSEEFAITHWLKHGAEEKRKYRDPKMNLDNFNWQERARLTGKSMYQVYAEVIAKQAI